MYALDTNSLSYYLKGKGQVAERLLAEPPSNVGVPSVVLYEIAYGAVRANAPAGLKERLGAFLGAFRVLPFGEAEARTAARIRVDLEKASRPVGVARDPYVRCVACTLATLLWSGCGKKPDPPASNYASTEEPRGVNPVSATSKWQEKLEGLAAPPNVLSWAKGQTGEFHDAWKRCDDPLVRVWVARAGGVSQAGIVGAVGQLLQRALRASDLLGEQRATIGSSLDTLFGYLQGQRKAEDVDAAADKLMSARMGWDGPAKDLAFAVDQLLRSSKDVDKMDMPHDFMWLVDASSALKVVVSGFNTQGFINPGEADKYLASVWQPSGSAPDSNSAKSLTNLEGLTDRQIVGRVYLRAMEQGNKASKAVATVAITVELENEVLNGGFGQYFFNRNIDAGTNAVAAYQSLGRNDLAETVASAKTAASAIDRSDLLGHADFSKLNATFLRQLKDDPTKARADFARKNASVL